MTRTATAVWTGGLKDGNGRLDTQSKALVGLPYSFHTRFESEPGTNPEELIGAAHAGCFSMALSGQLAERGITSQEIRTEAAVTMENLTITSSKLTVTVVAPGADEAKVREAAEAAEKGCPVSKALNLRIEMNLTVQA